MNTEELMIRMGFDASEVQRGTATMMAAQMTAAEKVKGIWKDIGGHIMGFIGFGAIVASLDRAAERVKEINAGSSKTGLTTDTYQQLSQIADEELPDGAEKLDAAITKLNVNIGKGSAEFEKWGIHSRNAQDAVFEIADRMHSMTDPAQKAAMAVDLMGRGGAQLVPLLERGAAALRQMGSEKLIFSKEDLENIAKAHQQVEELQNRLVIWTGKAVSGIAEFAQALGRLSVPGSWSGDNKERAHEWMAAEQAEIKAKADAEISAEDAPADADFKAKFNAAISANATAADVAQRAAEGKAAAEKKATEEMEKQVSFNRQYDSLLRQRHKIEKEAGDVEKEIPTVENLAGRRFTENLNKLYGKGGRYDLGLGNGPFAAAAQDYELAQKQQVYNRTYGNSAMAESDRRRMINDKNILAGAGLESDSMKFEDMKQHLSDINDSMAALLKKADSEGIAIADPKVSQ